VTLFIGIVGILVTAITVAGMVLLTSAGSDEQRGSLQADEGHGLRDAAAALDERRRERSQRRGRAPA
jgi:hypothetical protein